MDVVENFHDWTASEWIRRIPLDIEDDRVSLWDLLGIAGGLGLDTATRVEFISHCLRSLLDAGAVPVEPTMWAWPPFRRTDRFGTKRDEIVENVIADWQARGGGDLEWGEYPFTFPENFEIQDNAEWRCVNEARLRRLFPELDWD
ncbi:hypothetical protein GCM10011390_10060 [Aureimonas endophytica]|uniref:Uncharacterized protein n=1 Tax=Aureimonas endophytica TaxID=2027858 RepID=A0A916ZFZ2_9HYPH|nr:hypothetical protein [Aureimonas endophytica]GGD93273.1 hypothetical protein GCM10011390_10060 [Aureimonas endophytica]